MGLFRTMQTKPKRTMSENGIGGSESALALLIESGEDLGDTVRHAFEVGKPDTLLQQLKSIAKNKEIEIEELCNVHYEDFIVAVYELRGVLIDAEEMKKTLSSENSRLQDVGSSLLLKLDEILELNSMKRNIAEATEMLKICLQVANLCIKCNQHVSNNHFYPALKTLNLIEKDYLQHIPLTALQNLIKKQIPAIRMHIEKKVCSEFDNWVAQIRNTEKEIGQLAIVQATTRRQREEEKRSRQRELEEQSHSGSTECVFALDIEGMDEDPAAKLDLTPVCRAFHMHTQLGIQDQFRDYYSKSRLLQLNSELQIPQGLSFLESHQMLFYQIVGYFIVESRVLQTVRGLLLGSQVEKTWDTALDKLTSVLDEKFSSIEATDHLLLIKDHLTLLVATLERYGYQAAPLFKVLEKTADKYHELLFDDCRKKITDIIANDTYEQMVMKNENEYSTNVLSFDLQTSDIMPIFPYMAPFSSTVPEACRIVQSFIKASVSYLSYGNVKDCSDNARKYLDKLLIYVLSEALLKAIHSTTTRVSQAMQIAANINILEHACDLFLWQAVRLCGIPLQPSERPHVNLAAMAVLRTSQDAAYHTLLKLVNSKAGEIMSLTDNIDWSASEVPQDGSDYINVLICYLDTLFSTAQQILPLEPIYRVGSGVLKNISDSFVAVLLSDGVKRFNINTIASIDNDLKQLETFADRRFLDLALDELEMECSFRDCLLEARQLINLLLSNHPEHFMDPVIREELYGALDYDKVSSILEKLKERPEKPSGSLPSKSTKPHAHKKSIDFLKKKLRDYN